MTLHHRILEKTYKIFEKKTNKTNDQLRVIILHDIKKSDFFILKIVFEKLLEKGWTFLSPDEFKKNLNNASLSQGKKILITFDDGYLSQYHLAKQILKPLGIKSIFFLVYDFLKISNLNQSIKFAKERLLIKKIPEADISQYNMSVPQAQELILDGHEIGFHTKSHPRLSSIFSEQELESEIINYSKSLCEELNLKKIDCFAFTFGDMKSISREVVQKAFDNYRYIFSGFRGNNYNKKKLIFRDHIEPYFSDDLIFAFLNGYVDFYYKKNYNQVEKWILKN